MDCDYCYYLKKEHLYPKGKSFRMPDDVLEAYIGQHIAASADPVIHFSWHGGEPTLLGVEYFRKILSLQRKHKPPARRITNGMQTNGILIDEEWCRFLEGEAFAVGFSLDGPREMHDRHRLTKSRKPTHAQAMRGYQLLRKYRIPCDLLCVVNAYNVQYPIQVYQFFKEIEAGYIGFLPIVEPLPGTEGEVSDRTVPAEAFGDFLCAIYDEWLSRDIGRIRVQIFDEVAGKALGHDQTLCIFQKTCGRVPVIEHNGDFFSCDHFVDPEHHLGNIRETPLVDLLESRAQRAFGQAKWKTLPRYCRACEVRDVCNGGCPKDRIRLTPDGEEGLNYLCAGYKRFFTYSKPFVSQLTALQARHAPKRQTPSRTEGNRTDPKIGRNDPCPCGSGRKYKKCCLGK
jgi:uncharacterized protein